MSEVITLKEVAEYLRVKPCTIYRLCKLKKIPAIRFVNNWRFEKNLIIQWMEVKQNGEKNRDERRQEEI